MSLLGGALYLLLLGAVGYLVVVAADARRRLPLVELAGLMITLGTAGLGMLIFWLSLTGWAPTRPLLLALGGGVALALVATARVRGWVRPALGVDPADRKSGLLAWLIRWAWVPLAIVAAAPLLVTLIDALGLPPYEWDATAIWYYKAQVLAHEPARQSAYFHDVSMSYSHLDYPLLLPSLLAAMQVALGQAGVDGSRVLLPLLYAGLGLMVYAGLRPQLSRVGALLLAALLLWTPVLWHWSGGGTADTPLAVFLAGLAGYGGRWLRERRASDLLYAGIFAAAAAQTKQEGLVVAGGGLALAVLLGVWYARGGRAPRPWQALGLALGLALLLALPWLALRHGLPKTHENYGGRLTPAVLLLGVQRLPAVASDFWDRMSDVARFGKLWLLLIPAAVLGWRAWKAPAQQFWWLLLAGQLSAYALAFMITPWDLHYLLTSAADRVLGQACPLVVWLIGGHWAALQATPKPPT